MHKKKLVLLGATGSIGDSSLQVLREHTGEIELTGIAGYHNWDKLATIAREFDVQHVGLFDPGAYKEASHSDAFPVHTTFYQGEEGLRELACLEEADTLIVAISGTAGLKPTLAAIEQGKQIALASKEVLVKAGKFVMELAHKHQTTILPVDSEHNALFQCLEGHPIENVSCLRLTASGGPFLNAPLESFQNIRPKDALKHPSWEMGKKITIDSSTMANKGLELIEARWLFHVKPEQLDVVIHPQSLVHSMVQFRDGNLLAHLCPTSMTYPIRHCLLYPHPPATPQSTLDFTQALQLEFQPVDTRRFICLKLAWEALQQEGTAPTIFNAANEVAVDAFLKEQASYLMIPEVIDKTLNHMDINEPTCIEEIEQVDQEARNRAKEILTTTHV